MDRNSQVKTTWNVNKKRSLRSYSKRATSTRVETIFVLDAFY